MFLILYNIIMQPIELVVEIVFELLFRLVGQRSSNQGLAVIGVSVCISLLTLPLYRRADMVQQQERDIQAALAPGIKRIRKAFKGDERFMMLQAYYREHSYSPLSALKGSLSLLLEIPFFIAAYHFLSHLEALRGASFGPIADLGKPDGLFSLGGVRINLLPILMTLINCLSGLIYLKGFPLKAKIQVYGFALIFLVLLYNSPSGLVVYWTCNNIFSLVKNIFYKLKEPRKVFNIFCLAAGVGISGCLFASGILDSRKKCVAVFFFFLLTALPLLASLVKSRGGKKCYASYASFFASGLFLTVLLGVLIPSAVIASSPSDFVDINHYKLPVHFLLYSTCYAAGFFLLWGGIIYGMANLRLRQLLEIGIFILSAVFLVDYMCFGKNLGVLSEYLTFDVRPSYSLREKLLNAGVVAAIALVLFSLLRIKKLRSYAPYLSVLLLIGVAGVSVGNVVKICAGVKTISRDQKELGQLVSAEQEEIPLSPKGRNVIVFMLDKAISGYLPYIMEEKPELKKSFEGFTYYPNCLSFGGYTVFGAPPLFGGYEYTPAEMNKRESELLIDKHHEALKVLPVLFDEHSFKVTVCDMPLTNYSTYFDASIYKDYPGITGYRLQRNSRSVTMLKSFTSQGLDSNKRDFFCYSVFKVVPLVFQTIAYDKGRYFTSERADKRYEKFLRCYSVLYLLPELTVCSSEPENTFLMIDNDTTHDPCVLQLPDYTLETHVDNTGLHTAADGHIGMETETEQGYYHCNMASLMQLAKWFDYMREQGVYDNSRIIIVADHGNALGQFDSMLFAGNGLDVQEYNPLLLVKDFGSNGEFSVSDKFMTHADTPSLAMEGLIPHPKNPFTGKEINMEPKENPQLVTSSSHHSPTTELYTFDTSDGHWYSVHDDIFREENWKQLD